MNVGISKVANRSVGAKLSLKHGVVTMSHGAGGRAMQQLIEQLFMRAFRNEWLDKRDDQAVFAVSADRMVMTTDSYVVSPIFFPGGDIGCLAVNGTINDLAMAGAVPKYLSVGFILEEGFALADLACIVDSMARAAADAGVAIVTGDTKVVEKGHGDGIYINTTGIGELAESLQISASRAQVGDKVFVSGSIGDHGVAIMSKRQYLDFESPIKSDTAALHQLVADMVQAVADIHCMRDPTRGGLASTLNEIAWQSNVGIYLQESAIPVRTEVAGACELLGLDPLYVANEGKLLAICAPQDADQLLKAMQANPLGKDAAVIGEVIADEHHLVQMRTSFGGERLVDWLSGEQLPRIC